jgi:hypothetical protein
LFTTKSVMILIIIPLSSVVPCKIICVHPVLHPALSVGPPPNCHHRSQMASAGRIGKALTGQIRHPPPCHRMPAIRDAGRSMMPRTAL